jgi:elongation factor Ts
MTNITADLIKKLREKTGVGMMDCKKALVEVVGDFDEAIAWLRKKGHASASKKAGRATAEGLSAIVIDGSNAAIVEVNCETDFVARNEKFQELVDGIRKLALQCDSVEELKKAKYSNSDKTVDEEILSSVTTLGENITLGRTARFSINKGCIAGYVHNALMDNGGKISVLVMLESELPEEKLQSLAKQIAMHIAAAKPEFLKIEDVNPTLVEKEKEIFVEQAKATGKPDNVIEKMIVGKIQKYYQEIVLQEQAFIMDNKLKITDVIKNFEKENDGKVELKSFARYEVGQAS